MTQESVKLTLKGRTLTFTALSFKQLRVLRPSFAVAAGITGNGVPDDEQIDAVVAICHASLSSAQPDITVETVEDLITLATIGPAIAAVAGVSGLEEVKEAAPGE